MKEIEQKLWAVGGGKGGVGKSITSLMFGSSLARQGKKVVLVDADLGGSNLHTLAGIRYPLYTLADFLNRQVKTIEEVVIDTPVKNLRLICGADDILGIANPKSAQKMRIFNNLKRLDADYIILDLGAGSSFTSMDFFLYAPNKIVVLTPQITSIQNAYGFIKASLYRQLNSKFRKDPYGYELIKRASSGAVGESIDSVDKLKEAFMSLEDDLQEKLQTCLDTLNIKVIVNMVRNNKERDVGNIVRTVTVNYLSIALDIIGIVPYDKVMGMSINNMPEFLSKRKYSIASTSFYDIASNVIRNDNRNLPPRTEEKNSATAQVIPDAVSQASTG